MPSPIPLPPLLEWIPEVSPELTSPYHLAPWCSMLERAGRRESVRGLCAIPIRHHKTTTTVHGIAHAIKNDPRLNVIYMTHSQLYANTRGRQIRDLSARVGVNIQKGHNTIHDWKTEEGGGVLTMSAQASALGQDVDWLVWDDPFESADEASKPEVRQRVDETIAFYTSRLSVGGSVTGIMSRFHPDDAYGRRLRRTAVAWEEVTSAALLNEGTPEERAFAPEVRTVEQLKVHRAELKEVEPREQTWWSQFQNDPRAQSGDLFRSPKRYGELPTEPGWRDVMGIDLAYSRSKRADWFALVLLRMWGSTAYVRKVERLKADMSVLVMTIRAAWAWNAQSYDPDEQARGRCPIFSYVSGPEIGAIAYLAELGINVNALPARFNKLVRAQKTIDVWNDGRILVPHGTENDGFLGRVAGFRGVESEDEDDEVDALVSAADGGLWSTATTATRALGQRRV